MKYRAHAIRGVLASVAMAMALAVLVGCPPHGNFAGKLAVLLQADMADGSEQKTNQTAVPHDDIAAIYVTLHDVLVEHLMDSGSEFISTLSEDRQLDLTALHEIQAFLSLSSLPAGGYTGGYLSLASAQLEYKNSPGMLFPIALPPNGELPFAEDFTLAPGEAGVLELHLNDVQVCVLEDDSLAFSPDMTLEASFQSTNGPGGPANGDHVEVLGRIDNLDLANEMFTLKTLRGEIAVDISQANIFLPAVQTRSDSVPGTPSQLNEGDRVFVTGTLYLDPSAVIVADTVEVIGPRQTPGGDDGDDDGDDNGDHDGDDNGDDDGDHDGDDNGGDDGGDDDHGGGTGQFDQDGNTAGFGIPAGLMGNAFTGEALWTVSCAVCHPTPYGRIDAEPFGEIREALVEVPQMAFLSLTRQETADITAYLNWDGSGTPPQLEAPANVQASDGTFTDKVAVTWAPSTGATGYEVWRNTSGDSSGATQIGTPAAASFDDTTAVVGTTYNYWVKATDANGASSFSNPDTGFVGQAPPPTAPAAPTNVQATDGAFADKVVVTWNASVDAADYEVWRNTIDDSSGATQIGTPAGTSFDDMTAVAGTTYYYWVKATNAVGPSGFSTSDAGNRATTPPPAPTAPTNVQASDGTYTDKVAVTWNVSPGATSYEVWRNTVNASAGATLIGSPAGAAFDDTTAVAGTTYYYWVKAVGGSGTSGFSASDAGSRAQQTGPFDGNGNTTAFGIPAGFVGNINAGTTVWSSKCASCHPSPFGAVGAFTYPILESRLSTVPLMAGVSVSQQEKADLTAYLNRAAATP